MKFNVVNFTKDSSLYEQGMRICIAKRSTGYEWFRGGEDIVYEQSHLIKKFSRDKNKIKYYYKLSFSYHFDNAQDLTLFSYAQPYTFSDLTTFISDIMAEHKLANGTFMKEAVLCKSLGGLDVPMLVVSSRLVSEPKEYMFIKQDEFFEASSKNSMPLYKRKKQIVIDARVHPGEANSSYMMQGFIKYITGNSY